MLSVFSCAGDRSGFSPRVVKPELLAAVRSVVSNYPMVSVSEKSAEVASKVQAVVVDLRESSSRGIGMGGTGTADSAVRSIRGGKGCHAAGVRA